MTGALDGKHAFITGGGHGIGGAIADALAAHGAAITVTGRNRAKLEEKAASLPRAQAFTLDVTDGDAITATFAKAVEGFGPVAIMINNAGIADTAPFLRVTVDQVRRLMDVNMIGTLLCSQAALPAMLDAGWGRIVNIASMAGLKGQAYITSYCASKHAVLGMTRALAMEMIGKGVTVNAICPAYVETGMVEYGVKNIMEKTGRSEEEARASLAKFNPQGRIIAPSEVAATVVWMCLPGSESINGQAIPMG